MDDRVDDGERPQDASDLGGGIGNALLKIINKRPDCSRGTSHMNNYSNTKDEHN